jgi:hypothetical protein
VLRQVLVGLLALAAVLGLAVALRITWVGYGPTPTGSTTQAQARFLQRAIAGGAGDQMQRLFPEGDYFLRALTAMAEARTPAADLDAVRVLRDSLDRPESVAVFGSGMVPEHGIFQAGWALAVAVDLARASGTPADADDVRRRAAVVESALRGSRSGFLEGYPGQYWPCDTVVAASALADAAVLLNRPAWLDTVRTWRSLATTRVDPTTGLLPHRVDADGRPLDGPRGSSQSIIQAFWPAVGRALDGRVDPAAWEAFRQTFVVREAGLVGVREFPRGQDGPGDVDSGPLLLGVSASASTVTLAAARAIGDTELADDLSREAELLGLPSRWGGEQRYALGLLPVGDAFLAWARTRPLELVPQIGGDETSVRPWWPLLAAPFLVPLVALVLVGRRSAVSPVNPGNSHSTRET